MLECLILTASQHRPLLLSKAYPSVKLIKTNSVFHRCLINYTGKKSSPYNNSNRIESRENLCLEVSYCTVESWIIADVLSIVDVNAISLTYNSSLQWVVESNDDLTWK